MSPLQVRTIGAAGLLAWVLTMIEIPLWFTWDVVPSQANVLARTFIDLGALAALLVFWVGLTKHQGI